MMAHAEEAARTVHAAAEWVLADMPEEEEHKPGEAEADWGIAAEDALSEITDDDDEQDEVPADCRLIAF